MFAWKDLTQTEGKTSFQFERSYLLCALRQFAGDNMIALFFDTYTAIINSNKINKRLQKKGEKPYFTVRTLRHNLILQWNGSCSDKYGAIICSQCLSIVFIIKF